MTKNEHTSLTRILFNTDIKKNAISRSYGIIFNIYCKPSTFNILTTLSRYVNIILDNKGKICLKNLSIAKSCYGHNPDISLNI